MKGTYRGHIEQKIGRELTPLSLAAKAPAALVKLVRSVKGEKPVWLRGRAVMSVLAGMRERNQNGTELTVIGTVRGPFSSAEDLYMTGFGDQLEIIGARAVTWNFDNNEITGETDLLLQG